MDRSSKAVNVDLKILHDLGSASLAARTRALAWAGFETLSRYFVMRKSLAIKGRYGAGNEGGTEGLSRWGSEQCLFLAHAKHISRAKIGNFCTQHPAEIKAIIEKHV
ncbi:MAG: hypothetical protein AB8E87_00515 [Prochlorococcus sp.]